MGHARCPYHSRLSASKTPWLRLVETRMIASFAKWPITSPMMIATCRRDPVSHRVEGAEQKTKTTIGDAYVPAIPNWENP